MISTLQVCNLIEWLAENNHDISHDKYGNNGKAFEIGGESAGADASGWKYPRVVIPHLASGTYKFTTGIIDLRTITFQIIDNVEEGNYHKGVERIFFCQQVAYEFIKKLRALSDTPQSGWEQVLQVLEFDNIAYMELDPSDLGNNCYGFQVTLSFKAAFSSVVDGSKWS